VRAATALVLLVGFGGFAEADTTDARARAEAHFEAGRGLYRLGNYSDALREFSAGYELTRLPTFLLDIGQCYRRLKDPVKARAAYEQYLAVTPEGDPARPQAAVVLDELTIEIAQRATAPPPEAVVAAAIQSRPLEKAERPAPRSRWRRFWWLLPVSATVAAGVALGAYFGTRSSGCQVNIGCLDLRP
jgi:tetratricopeptide (TPR) repeat protein